MEYSFKFIGQKSTPLSIFASIMELKKIILLPFKIKMALGFYPLLRKTLLILLFILTPLTALAERAVLTEQQALALFYQRNLNTIAAKYGLAQAKAEEIIAAAIPNPILNLDMDQIAGHYPV